VSRSRVCPGYTGGLGGREAIIAREGFDPIGYRECAEEEDPRIAQVYLREVAAYPHPATVQEDHYTDEELAGF
jgi:hypothetical protein